MIRAPFGQTREQLRRWLVGRAEQHGVDIERLRRDVAGLQRGIFGQPRALPPQTIGAASDSCCERGTPVGVDSLNFETSINSDTPMTRASTANNYESSSFTLTGGDGTGTYKLVGDEEGDEISSGSGIYAMTIVLTYVSGSYSGYEATYRSAEPWASGGRDQFLLMPDGSDLADGTTVNQNLPDEDFPSSFCGVATA